MKKQTMITLALALTPPSLLYGQEYPERSHQHCHVEVEADVSYQANRNHDTNPPCLL